jgi:hypothetical protein
MKYTDYEEEKTKKMIAKYIGVSNTSLRNMNWICLIHYSHLIFTKEEEWNRVCAILPAFASNTSVLAVFHRIRKT